MTKEAGKIEGDVHGGWLVVADKCEELVWVWVVWQLLDQDLSKYSLGLFVVDKRTKNSRIYKKVKKTKWNLN